MVNSSEQGVYKWLLHPVCMEFAMAFFLVCPLMVLKMQELDWLPHNFNKEDYIECRNHILAKWRTHPTKVLSEEGALEEITAKYKGLGLAAYQFLNLNGYINFGVGKDMQLEMKNNMTSAGISVLLTQSLRICFCLAYDM